MRSSEWNLYKNTVTNTYLLKINHSLKRNKFSLSPQVELPLKRNQTRSTFSAVLHTKFDQNQSGYLETITFDRQTN